MASSTGSTSTSSTSSMSPQAATNTLNTSLSTSAVNNNKMSHGSLIANEHVSKAPTTSHLIDLNDIYCYFPEMSTHQLNEVQDFTQMCAKLFQLDETIQTQKQVLSNLEFDLQRELTNPNQQQQHQHQQHHQHPTCMSPVPAATVSETPETAELRKEVTLSREQTRLQCKQLHDLDAKIRSNEQSLMIREQQLQQLLEELYIQEIYADNALEKALTTSSQDQQQQQQHQNHHHHQHMQNLAFPSNGLV